MQELQNMKNVLVVSDEVADALDLDIANNVTLNGFPVSVKYVNTSSHNYIMPIVTLKAINYLKTLNSKQEIDTLNYYSNFYENISRIVDFNNNEATAPLIRTNIKLQDEFNLSERGDYILNLPKIRANSSSINYKQLDQVKPKIHEYCFVNEKITSLKKYLNKLSTFDANKVDFKSKTINKKLNDLKVRINDTEKQISSLETQKSKLLSQINKTFNFNANNQNYYDIFASYYNRFTRLEKQINDKSSYLTQQDKTNYKTQLQNIAFLVFKTYCDAKKTQSIPDMFYALFITKIEKLLERI